MEVNRSTPTALFLGAGASVSSGVPSASTCIWQWKQQIFLTLNPGLELQFAEISLPSVQQRIQDWLDNDGRFPPAGAPDEYGFYADHCYPIPADRRQYFQRLAAAATPYVGYRLLPLLTDAGLITGVWTTNFDGLAARSAATSRVTPIEVGLDSAQRLMRPPRQGELVCVALHGDYRYDDLKNTPAELQRQDAELRRGLVEQLRTTTLIVVGYSGRDASAMAALAEAYAQPGPGRLVLVRLPGR